MLDAFAMVEHYCHLLGERAVLLDHRSLRFSSVFVLGCHGTNSAYSSPTQAVPGGAAGGDREPDLCRVEMRGVTGAARGPRHLFLQIWEGIRVCRSRAA